MKYYCQSSKVENGMLVGPIFVEAAVRSSQTGGESNQLIKHSNIAQFIQLQFNFLKRTAGMADTSNYSLLQKQQASKDESEIQHSLLIQNAALVNFRYLTCQLQKESQLQNLILTQSTRIFNQFQLAVVLLLACGILTPESLQKVYYSLVQQLQVLSVCIMVITMVRFSCLMILMFSSERQRLVYRMSYRLLAKTRVLGGLLVMGSSGFVGTWAQDLVYSLVSAYVVVQNSLFGNFTERKGFNYCFSLSNNAVSDIFGVVNIYLSAYCINKNTSYTYVCLVVTAFLYLVWYMKRGYLAYFHPQLKKLHSISSCIYLSLASVLLACLLGHHKYTLLPLIAELLVSFGVISAFFKVNQPDGLNQSHFDYKTIKQLELQLLKSEPASSDQFSHFYHGFIFLHQQGNCNNPSCYANLKQIYDPENNLYFAYENKTEAVQIRLRLIVKCLYEHFEKENPQNISLLLNFMQFAYNQLKNQWIVFRLYRKLLRSNLTYFEKFKMEVIFLLMKNQKDKMNHRIYQSKMQIQNVLEAEDTFTQILELIQKYFFCRKQIVSYLRQSRTIEIGKVSNDVALSFSILDQINHRWKFLETYRRINKKWDYFRLICYLFLENRTLNKKMIQKLQKHENGNEIQSRPIYLDQHQKLQNQKTLFHFQSFYIHARSENDQTVIQQVSKHIQLYLHYEHYQLIGSNIERLMPVKLKQSHSQKMKQWFQKGYSSNQYTYDIKFTRVVSKMGKEMDAVKYFKVLLTSHGTMDFICLIKINTEQSHPFFLENEKELQRSFYFSSYPNSLGQIESETLGISSQSSMVSQNKQRLSRSSYKSLDVKKNELNIFIKNDNLVTVKEQFERFQTVKKLIRLFFAFVAVFALTTAQYTNLELASTQKYCTKYLNFMAVYRLPIFLNINYVKAFFRIGNQTLLNNQITSQTQQYISLLHDPDILNTVFDTFLNKEQYFSPIPADQFNRNMTYDQIDLFFQIASLISTLSNLTIDHSNGVFQELNSYLFPCFNTLMNNTKFVFHDNFQNLFASSQSTEIYILVFFIGFTLGFFVFVLYKFKQSFISLGCVSKIMAEMQPKYLQQIDAYDAYLFRSFEKFADSYKLQLSDRQLFRISKSDSEKKNLKSKANLNKNYKIIKESDEISRFKLKSCSIYFLACTACLIFISVSKTITIFNLSHLSQLQTDSFSFLRYYPTSPIVAMGVFDVYLATNSIGLVSFYPQKYKDALNDMSNLGQFAYIDDNVPQTPFYLKRKNYFFGNPCAYNPSVLVAIGMSVSQCESLYDGVYKRGIVSYFRITSTIGDQCINKNRRLSKRQIAMFAIGVSITSSFMVDAIGTWTTQFHEYVSSFQRLTMTLAVCCFFATLLIHWVLFQLFLFRKMESAFQLEKKMFKHFIPEGLMVKEKIIFQNFINSGLITN